MIWRRRLGDNPFEYWGRRRLGWRSRMSDQIFIDDC